MAQGGDSNHGNGGGGAAAPDPAVQKFDRLDAAQKSIKASRVWAEKGLNRNPRPEEERKLNESILEMDERISILEARIISVLNGTGGAIPMPSDDQVSQTAILLAEVEGLTNNNLTAAAALSVTTKGLKLVRELTA